MIDTLYKLIICHLIGDYVLQSNFIATTKGKNIYHLIIHCLLYSLPFYLAFGMCWQLVIITLLHFPIDIAKAKYNKLSYLTDQIIHYILICIYFIKL